NAARPAKLFPLFQEFPVLVENLNAAVGAISDEESSPGIDGDGMKAAELTSSRSFLAPGFDEFSIFAKLHDPPARVLAMSVRDENVSVRSNHKVGGINERVRTIPGDSRLAERQQDFSLGIELQHLRTLAIFRLPVGCPDVAILVHVETVGIYKDSRAKTRHQPARGIEFEDGCQVGADAAVCAASLERPDIALAIHVHRDHRSKDSSLR